MSLDTKYRPMTFKSVVGQDHVILVLRNLLKTGVAHNQSYVLAGPFGCGKTTIARILARALLCQSVTKDGDPCDACDSCRSMLEHKASDAFVEVDAATHSGKDDILEFVRSLDYATFSSNRRIFLFDEAHRLSQSALDALLKPMEEASLRSTQKKMVCIFCTTEPEKMKSTILSRCAPVFSIRTIDPGAAVKRMSEVASSEGYEYEVDALLVIAKATKYHMRDSLKSMEAIASVGPITKDGAMAYFNLDVDKFFVTSLLAIHSEDRGGLISNVDSVLSRLPPSSFYERMSDLCLSAYSYRVGVQSDRWEEIDLHKVSMALGDRLLGLSRFFGLRPKVSTRVSVMCDALMCIGQQPLQMKGAEPPPVPQAVTPVSVQAPPKQASDRQVAKKGNNSSLTVNGVNVGNKIRSDSSIANNDMTCGKITSSGRKGAGQGQPDDVLDADAASVYLSERIRSGLPT